MADYCDDCRALDPFGRYYVTHTGRRCVSCEVKRLAAERDEWKRATLRWHEWALALCQPPHEHWPLREQISEGLTTARAERDALQRHFDAAAPEHNLPALLDLYFERQQKAEKEREEAREMLRLVLLGDGYEPYLIDRIEAHLGERQPASNPGTGAVDTAQWVDGKLMRRERDQ